MPILRPRFFPLYQILDGWEVQFRYQKSLERDVTCTTYLVQTIDPTTEECHDQVRYEIVHQKMADAGLRQNFITLDPFPFYWLQCSLVWKAEDGGDGLCRRIYTR